MKLQIIDAMRHKHLETGYGQMAAAIHSGLKDRGHEVYWENEDCKEDIRLWCRPPHYIKYDTFHEDECNIFFTMHEKKEFDGWKADWPILLNKCKAIIVPTEWNKEIFRKHGTTVPIYVCPLGVNTRLYSPEEVSIFKILAVHEGLGNPSSREDWQTTFEALKYFQEKDNILLTIKTWNDRRIDLPRNVELLHLQLCQTDMGKLYRQHNLFIKNSVTEGWSLPFTEAIVTGMEVIASDCPVLRENAKDYPAMWFKYGKVDQLKNHINQVYKRWRDELAVLQQYDWKYSIDKLEGILNEVRIGRGGKSE